MTEKRFTHINEDIFQYGEWYCSAKSEHCADVIATALNELIEENEQLKSENIQLTVDNKELKCTNNELYQENEELKQTIDNLTSEFEGYHKSLEETKDYEKQFEITSCPYEIRNNKSLDYYWLEHQGNVIGICKVLNEQSDKITELEKENEQLKKQIERIDFILDDLNGAEYISRDDGIKALNKIDKVIGKR